MKMRFVSAAAVTSLLLSACATPPDCSAQGGFERGRQAESAISACPSEAYGEAWRLGQALGELEREQAGLAARSADLDAAGRQRLRVLAREIPELETLARLRGLMPAAQIDPANSPPARDQEAAH